MLRQIKKYVPQPLKNQLSPIRQRWQKIWLFHHMQKKHQLLLVKLKEKKRIRVVFLAIHKSVWKVDTVFQKMAADTFFEPFILVCPYIAYGEERMREEMTESLEFFKSKGYPTYSSYIEKEARWIKLEELAPDILIFTNPHNLTRKEYYEDGYLNYLSCYIPYHHEVGSYGNNESQHGQVFHVAMWKIYAAHNSSYELYKTCSPARGRNVVISGFPATEKLSSRLENGQFKTPWRSSASQLKIIWAPHHIIEEPINQSTFLQYSQFFLEIANKYKKEIAWAFKPHPILKSKLYQRPDWGKNRTDAYYNFWASNRYTQLETGDYEDLFLSSDAMIHDCGSFLAEYLYVKKPTLYLLSPNHTGQFFNDFGKNALNACRHAKSKKDVEDFILGLLKGEIKTITESHDKFIDEKIKIYFEAGEPSDNIISDIKYSTSRLTQA